MYKKLIDSAQYNFLRTNPHLGENIILLGLSGSHAYGTNVPTSDIDIRGVAVNTKQEILSGKYFEQVIDKNTDTTVYSVMKIIKLLTDANPNVLEMLFLKPEHYLILTPIGQQLIDARNMFLSKRVIRSFGGYARAQLVRLQNKEIRSMSQSGQESHILRRINDASSTFPEKYFQYPDDSIRLYIDSSAKDNMESEIFMDVHLHHYPLRDYKCMWSEMHNIVKDFAKTGQRAKYATEHNRLNKHALHLVRLLTVAIELLETGTFCTYRDSDHDWLMSIRNGTYTDEDGQMKPEFFEMVEELESRMDKAVQHTDLPNRPDYDKIDAFVCKINEQIVTGNV